MHSIFLAGRVARLLIVLSALFLVASRASADGPERPEIAAQIGHAGQVQALAFSPEGRLFASIGSGGLGMGGTGRLVLWDLDSGRILRSISLADRRVSPQATALGFSADGGIVAVLGDEIVGIGVADGRERYRLKVSSTACAVSAKGWAACADRGGEVRLVDLAIGKVMRSFKSGTTIVRAMAVSHDGRRIAVANGTMKSLEPGKGIVDLEGGSPGKLFVHDAATGKVVAEFTGPDPFFSAVAFSPDDALLAAGNYRQEKVANVRPGDLLVWRTESRELVKSLSRGDPTSNVTGLVFTLDGALSVALDGWNGGLQSWAVDDWRPLATSEKHGQFLLATHPAQPLVATATNGTVVSLYNARTAQLVTRLRGRENADLRLDRADERTLVLSTNSGWQRWNVADLARVHALAAPAAGSTYDPASDRRVGVVGGKEPALVMWNAATGEELFSVPRPEGQVSVSPFVVGPGGRYLLAALSENYSDPGRLAIYDSQGTDLTVEIKLKERPQQIVPTAGTVFYVAYENAVAIYELSGKLRQSIATKRYPRLQRYGAAGVAVIEAPGIGPVQLFDGPTARPVARWASPAQSFGPLEMLAIAPDGALLLQNKMVFDPRERTLLFDPVRNSVKVKFESISADPDGQLYREHLTGTPPNQLLAITDLQGKALPYRNDLQSVVIYPRATTDNAPDERAVLSANGRYLIEALRDGSLYVWNAQNGTFLRRLGGAEQAPVMSWQFLADDDLLSVLGSDGLIRLWRPGSGELVLTLFAFGADWLAVAPDGTYMGTPGGARSAALRVGTRVYGFDQVDLRLNRPDLVLQRLGQADERLIRELQTLRERRLRRLGIDPATANRDLPAPTVELVGSPPVFQQAPELMLKVAARDATGLRSLSVRVNDTPALGVDGERLDGKPLDGARESVTDLHLRLAPGLNRIQVSATNVGSGESLRRGLAVVVGQDIDKKPDLYVLSIGVSAYDEEKKRLRLAAKDAKDIAKFLADGAKDVFGQVHVHVLDDAKVSRESVRAEKAFLAAARPGDQIVVFLAGHGVIDADGTYYYAPPHLDFAAPSGQGIAFADFEALLAATPAQHKLMLVDTCHAGELDRDQASIEAARREAQSNAGVGSEHVLIEQVFADTRRDSGAVIIAAASGKDLAFEAKEWMNGAFTQAVLGGLAQGLSKRPRQPVLVSELSSYVLAQVPVLTGGAQQPVMRRDILDIDFRVF